MFNISDIENWLKEHEINNYHISEDFYVSVQGNVNLSDKLKDEKLPVRFDRINGNFDISNNNLTTLEGCPKVVIKDFNCSYNKLTSLFDCPTDVGNFDCSHNSLKNLSYGPKEVKGNYDCSFNELISIKASATPKSVKGYFKCNNNRLVSLEGGPKTIDAYFDCSSNFLENLMGGPSTVKENYICNSNRLNELDGVADEIGGDLVTDIKLSIDSKYDEETQIYRYKGSEAVSNVYRPAVALIDEEDIQDWLDKYKIKNTKILSDGSVDVKGDVKLSRQLSHLSKLPINFNYVDGDFDISENELTTLEGSPIKVGGSFYAYKNRLMSLRGGPREVSNFVISDNDITSLKNSPNIVKDDYVCSNNPLRTLEGINTVLGFVFTGVYIPRLRCQKYNYRGITTYKYAGDAIMHYIDEEYVYLTEEEKAFEATRATLEKAVKKMLHANTLTKDMVTDQLIQNLTKYHLDQLKAKVLWIKNPPNEDNHDIMITEDMTLADFIK